VRTQSQFPKWMKLHSTSCFIF